MNWLINYCYENPIVEDAALTEQLNNQYGPGRGSANEETIKTMENQRDGFINVIAEICPNINLTNEILPEEFDAEVTEITDGDTVKINYAGKELKVRLLGMNTPENGSYPYSCTGNKEPYLVRRILKPSDVCVNEELWYVDNDFYISTSNWLGANLPVHHISTFKSDLNDQYDDNEGFGCPF